MLRQSLIAPCRTVGCGVRVAATRRTFAPLRRSQFPPRTTPVLATRWYSETPAAASEAEKATPAETSAPAEKAEASQEAQPAPEVESVESKLQKELQAKEAENVDLKDRYLRSVAEFRTLQDKTARDMKAARAFAIEKFAKDLVTSVDNLDRGLTTVPSAVLEAEDDTSEARKQLVSLYDGLKLTEKMLMDTLKKHGLERMDPMGERYNPNEHEAEFMAPMAGKEDGTVAHVSVKGFKLNGRVLRAAKVGVAKNQ